MKKISIPIYPWAILTLTLCFLCVTTWLLASTQNKPKIEKIESWRMPEYMVENLRNMIEKFNLEFNNKMGSYKAELRKRFKEFKDMPEDVIFDMKVGEFFRRSDYEKIQRRALENIKKNTKNEEVKENEK